RAAGHERGLAGKVVGDHGGLRCVGRNRPKAVLRRFGGHGALRGPSAANAPYDLNVANISSKALSWLPAADDGTMIGVCTPASTQASSPSRTRETGPDNATSSIHLSVRYLGTSSGRFSAIAFSIAVIS